MSIWKRFAMIFSVKANKALDKAENVNDTLDYSYEKQVQMLGKVRKGLTDVATSRKQVEMQAQKIEKEAANYTTQAEKAIGLGREDLAREALSRKAALTTQLTELYTQRDQLAAEEEKLAGALRQLETKVAAFRTQKETIKARHTAAKAQTQIADSLTGLSGEFADVGNAIARAEDKTAQLQARASAVDELIASGALDSPALGQSSDPIARELNEIAANASVEDELAAIKARQLEAPSPILRQLEG